MKRLGVVLLVVVALMWSPEATAAPALGMRDAAVGAHAWMHRFFPRTSYRARCHGGPLDPWCSIRMGRTGCGCDFRNPESLGPLDLVVEPVRGGMVVHDGFWDLRLVLRWRPLF